MDSRHYNLREGSSVTVRAAVSWEREHGHTLLSVIRQTPALTVLVTISSGAVRAIDHSILILLHVCLVLDVFLPEQGCR